MAQKEMFGEQSFYPDFEDEIVLCRYERYWGSNESKAWKN